MNQDFPNIHCLLTLQITIYLQVMIPRVKRLNYSVHNSLWVFNSIVGLSTVGIKAETTSLVQVNEGATYRLGYNFLVLYTGMVLCH